VDYCPLSVGGGSSRRIADFVLTSANSAHMDSRVQNDQFCTRSDITGLDALIAAKEVRFARSDAPDRP